MMLPQPRNNPSLKDRMTIRTGLVADPSPVTDTGALICWCMERGIDPTPAIGQAMWSAVAHWYHASGRQADMAALRSVAAYFTAAVTGNPRRFPSEAMAKVLAMQGDWQAAGKPGLDAACLRAQHLLSGLRQGISNG